MGGSSAPEPDREAQQRQLQIEEERLALERQAALSRQEELTLLQQQLAEQQTVNRANVSLLEELNQQTIASQESLTALVNESTALTRRQSVAAQEEEQRARQAALLNEQRARSSLTSPSAGRQRQASPVFNEGERLSILSAVDI
jgi:hypothetical protein